jgi:hypothetical protein
MSWWLSIKMKIGGYLRIAVCAVAFVTPLSAYAAETGGCESFAWPIATELQWMKAADSEALASGTKLQAPPEKAIALSLLPMSKVSFPVAPSSKPRPNTGERYGGIVDFDGVTEAGLHQISLSIPGWIDVVQDGKTLKPSAHTGKSDCDGVRKSVRFDIGPGPFSIEISGIFKDTIKFAIRRAE